jgi:hypothetical protein
VWRHAAEHGTVRGVSVKREVVDTWLVQVKLVYPDAGDTAGR